VRKVAGREVDILEIGVYKGNLAIRMILSAKTSRYVGIDLFSEMSDTFLNREVSPVPDSIQTIHDRLRKFESANIQLLPGYSKEVLRTLSQKFDVIIIDGGHSYETVKEDFWLSLNLLKESGEIILDDWTNMYGVQKGYGVRHLTEELMKVDFLKVKVLNNFDFFPKSDGILVTRLVSVKTTPK
jgi:predicted O-methyltransferase YrrM